MWVLSEMGRNVFFVKTNHKWKWEKHLLKFWDPLILIPKPHEGNLKQNWSISVDFFAGCTTAFDELHQGFSRRGAPQGWGWALSAFRWLLRYRQVSLLVASTDALAEISIQGGSHVRQPSWSSLDSKGQERSDQITAIKFRQGVRVRVPSFTWELYSD